MRSTDQILRLVDEAGIAGAMGQEPRGTLVLAAPETLCTSRLPTSVANLQRSVSEGWVDIAFLLDAPRQATDLVREPFVHEPLLVVAPPDYHLVGAAKGEPADVLGKSVILVEGWTYHTWFKCPLNAAGAYPSLNLAINSAEAIKQCMLVGMGIAILPAVTVS